MAEWQYELIRSDRKTVALEVTRDGRVRIRAPRRMPQRDIDAFYNKHQDRMTTHPEPTPAEQQALIRQAKILLPQRVAYYAGRMQLQPNGITITGARTRFGSCSPKDRLCFSWRLMQYPPEAIDYVVVHELAHLVHRNHGPEFHALVASVLPDHKARRALLKE